jgi:hypothetical protein
MPFLKCGADTVECCFNFLSCHKFWFLPPRILPHRRSVSTCNLTKHYQDLDWLPLRCKLKPWSILRDRSQTKNGDPWSTRHASRPAWPSTFTRRLSFRLRLRGFHRCQLVRRSHCGEEASGYGGQDGATRWRAKRATAPDKLASQTECANTHFRRPFQGERLRQKND